MFGENFPVQTLHGPGLRSELSCDRDGQCLLEITQVEPAPGPWRLEVVWQPVDDRGLARGFACHLYQTPLAFATLLDERPRAYVWLPANISFELARKCYYCIVPQAPPYIDFASPVP